MKILVSLLLFLSSVVLAQSQTTGNLIYSTTNPAPQGTNYSWSGFVVTNSGGGGIQGGHVPGYNPALGQFMFGYTPGTIGYTLALNTALAGTGIQVSGIQYGFQYFNQDFSRGSLSTTVTMLNKQGDALQTYYHALGNTTEGWTNFDQNKTFASAYSLSNLGNVTMTFTGQDDRFWAGYYGPQFRNQYLRLTYDTDICASNPLSSPDCPGYAQALLDQQCLANPLSSAQCPGYAAAYLTQQCSINPLYNAQCPNYAQALFDQQCSINPLYSAQCPGYAQAYFNQQCSLNGLYDRTCPNFAEAYAKKMLLEQQGLATTVATAGVIAATAPSTVETSTNSNPATAGITDSTVKSAVTASDTVSPTSPTSVTSTSSVINPPRAPGTDAQPKPAVSETPQASAQQQQRQTESKKTETAVAAVERRAGNNAQAARTAATARAKELANEASRAATLEAQAANQGLIVGLIGFVPGFDAYQSAVVVDTLGATVARQYGRLPVDNRAVQRGLTARSDRTWQDMVDSQYNRGK